MRVVQQQCNRHATDVSAQRNNPFTSAEKPMKKRLEQTTRQNGEQNLCRTAIKAKYRAAENCIQCQESGERNSRIRPSGKYPFGSRLHFFRSDCLQSSGELQRGAHIRYESVGIVFHKSPATT